MYSLLFDLDGTLIESAPDIANALNVVLKDAGRATVTVDETRLLIGDAWWRSRSRFACRACYQNEQTL
jgi:phosphoglycolate phosphatase-like HAD superfamily hydrolase